VKQPKAKKPRKARKTKKQKEDKEDMVISADEDETEEIIAHDASDLLLNMLSHGKLV
jgi:hypothetical protein